MGLQELRCPGCGQVQEDDLKQGGPFLHCPHCGRHSQWPALHPASKEEPLASPVFPEAPATPLSAQEPRSGAFEETPASGPACQEPVVPLVPQFKSEEPAPTRRHYQDHIHREDEEDEDSSPVPLMPAEPVSVSYSQWHGPQQVLREARQELQVEHRRQRTWTRVCRGLGLLVASKLVETLLAMIVLLAFASRWLHGFFHTPEPLISRNLLGACGLLWLGSEILALVGYYQIFRAPLKLGLREWSLAALGVGWLRWLLCLGSSLLCLLAGREDIGFLAQALFLTGLFFLVQGFLHLVLLHRIGTCLQSYWLRKQVGQVSVLFLVGLLGWWGLGHFYPLPLLHPASPDLASNNLFLEFWLGCAGLILLLTLAGALCWHLRLLYNLWLVLQS